MGHDILIIDDDETDVEFLRTAFGGADDVVIHHAATGEDGLGFIRDRAPDLVLLDLRMPGLSGFDVLSAIRGDERIRRTRVVVLSSSGNRADVRSSYEGTANAYVTKPDSLDGYIQMARSIARFWLDGTASAVNPA